MALSATLLLSACSGSDNGALVSQWQAAASSAITPMAQRVPTMAQEASEWEEGSLDVSTYAPELSTTLTVMTTAHDRVSQLPPCPGHPLVDRLYLASMTLYVGSAKADQASLHIGDPALRTQIALLAERVRELGDRVFDQGRLASGQGLVPAGLSGAKVELPTEVPDWASEGLAPGPPLTTETVGPAGQPPHLPGAALVRERLAQLVQEEAHLASRASALAGDAESDPLAALAGELDTVAGLIR